MRELCDDCRDLIDVDFPKSRWDDVFSVSFDGKITTIAENERHRAIVLATPLPPASLYKRAYSAVKRAVLKILPDSYFSR